MVLQTDPIQRENERAGSAASKSAAQPLHLLRFAFLALAVAFWPPPIAAQTNSVNANDIMLQVAANQDRAERLRSQYIYEQKIRVASRRTNGKLARIETTIYSVIPTPTGVEKKLKSIEGRYLHKNAYIDFRGEPVPEADSIDGGLVHGIFRDELSDDKSKNGLGHDLFPLTTSEQKKYRFTLAGTGQAAGHEVYRVSFAPVDKSDLTWAGEALIDKAEFEPVSVNTKLSRKLPLLVRTMLGTDLPGLGFNVEYRRFDDGVWFPVSFGTEFRLRAVFFLNRDITISLENTGFKHAKADSTIEYAPPQ
jgi:hypothetical protein